jgi:hypothetical protein
VEVGIRRKNFEITPDMSAYRIGLRLGLKANIVVYGIPQSLFATQIPFGRLDADMSKQKLDLLEFSPCLVTEPRASAPSMPYAA